MVISFRFLRYWIYEESDIWRGNEMDCIVKGVLWIDYIVRRLLTDLVKE